MDYQGNFVGPPDDDSADFYAESPKGVIVQEQTGGGEATGVRRVAPPKDTIDEHRQIAYTDPHVHEAIETLTDWIVGDGFNIAPRNFEAAMETGVAGQAASTAQDGSSPGEGGSSDIQNLRRLLKNSDFWRVFNDWVRYALIDGHAFMELVVENEQFKAKLLPTERMHRDLDEFGNITEYVLEPPDGGVESDDAVQYAPHEIAELWFRKEPVDDFGRSFVEPVKEQADMLRDMEIDYARFIATKAYPPILWKLGNEDSQWTEEQVGAWMDNVQSIEPDSMLAAPHDVETEIVGATSTSSSAGAMRLEETFSHFEERVATGLGVPTLLMNMGGDQGEATTMMPAFKRRIKRIQNIVKTAVEQQILKSLLTESAGYEDFSDVIPEFQFGEHSNAEDRLEIDKLLKLLNNAMITPAAFAERAGLDPQEVPDVWANNDMVTMLTTLSGSGDSIQNPDGGAPTETEGGTESAGGEVDSRQDPNEDSSSGRNKSSITEDES